MIRFSKETHTVDNYPLLNLFYTMLFLFLWVAWILLLFRLISDVFRSEDLSGWGKAGWMFLILVLPWLGALVYLIARGDGIQARDRRQAEAARDAMAQLVSESSSARPQSAADQLSTLADLRSAGDLTDAEFQQQKDKVLAQAG